jgi:hypothetical protein
MIFSLSGSRVESDPEAEELDARLVDARRHVVPRAPRSRSSASARWSRL